MPCGAEAELLAQPVLLALLTRPGLRVLALQCSTISDQLALPGTVLWSPAPGIIRNQKQPLLVPAVREELHWNLDDFCSFLGSGGGGGMLLLEISMRVVLQ